MAEMKGEVRQALERWIWRTKWQKMKEKIPALRGLEDSESEMRLDESKVLDQFVYIYAHAEGFRDMLATQGLMSSVRMLAHSRGNTIHADPQSEKWNSLRVSLRAFSPSGWNYLRDNGFLNLAPIVEKCKKTRRKGRTTDGSR